MAVIQISKIQVRRGKTLEEGGMPQLASGEIGWSVDEQRLFIGNGSIAEGAPAIGNTEILTQFSTATINLFDSIYVYQDGVVVSGTGTNFPIERSLQERLDERVSVKSFGAVGNGSIDDTEAIRRAINQHYVQNSAQGYKKEIFFPAGNYIVSDTIYLPPNIKIVGEGSSNTIIRATGTNNISIFRTRSLTSVVSGTTFVAQPAQSDIVSNVIIDGIGFEYRPTNSLTATANQLLYLDQASNTVVKNCSFIGTWTLGQLVSTGYAGIIATGTSFSQDIKLENLHFSGMSNAISLSGDVNNISILSNKLTTLRHGIASGLITGNSGPNKIKAEGNVFHYIDREGIVVHRASLNTLTSTAFISKDNIFVNVGSGGTNDQIQSYPIINFNSCTDCVSVNDTFQRLDYLQTATTVQPLVAGVVAEIQFNEKRVAISAANTTTLAVIPYSNTMTGLVVNYVLEKGSNRQRKGSFIVNLGPAGVTYTDNYNYVGASTIEDLQLQAELRDSNSDSTNDAIVLKTYQQSDLTQGNISFSINYQT